jgi:aldose 1-epimerase
MTCPPDALNSKHDLLVIEPGGSGSAEWRIAKLGGHDEAEFTESTSRA